LVQRARIILAAAGGRENKDIAADLGCTRRTIGRWRTRFMKDRLAGIEHDAPRGGRTPAQRARFEAEIIRKTTRELPPNATQWSTRTLAAAIGSNDTLVQRVGRDNRLKPHRTMGFRRRTRRCMPRSCARFRRREPKRGFRRSNAVSSR